ncbi:MAG: TIGR03790 family protein [Verrucomicrobia bacterium]|nr:TIGR03790 family protein [Verrucomicrobiota bacterium]
MIYDRFRLICLAVLGVAALGVVQTAGQGDSAIVLYNSNVAGSKDLADYYATKRNVPSGQIFGFDLPNSETVSRLEFQNLLRKPLLKNLEKAKLVSVKRRRRFSARDEGATRTIGWSDARIRYAILCFGMPLKIANDSNLNEKEALKMPSELRKTEAAVDSELALLPIEESSLPLVGPFPNPVFGSTNAAFLHPTNGVLMVCRLDGPSLAIARGLVDKAIEAETEGLWGRAYFDTRGLTNGPNKLGDDWLNGAAVVTRRLGFETLVDDSDTRFSESFPMSQIAFYAGWYEYSGQVSGPFLQPEVEFMPGAFAYHLHSFSAATIRSELRQWVGPLLAKGATATMGEVFEPYLEFTPNIAMFLHRWIYMGFSLGEAAYACQGHLSWQTTVVGDPLYRPVGTTPKKQHAELAARNSKYLEWSLLKIVNINQETDLGIPELIGFLEKTPEAKTSPVLMEKLGDLYLSQVKFEDAVSAYRKAENLAISKQQRIRLNLSLSRTLEFGNKAEEAF